MSNSCKKYYDYVVCLLVYYHPRYISYYMIYDKCLYYTYWFFFHQHSHHFLGGTTSLPCAARQVMSGAAQVEQQHKDWNSDDEAKRNAMR